MVFLYATNATELCIGLDIGAVQGLLVDIITFGSFRRCLVAYKYTMLIMFQARYTPIETINTAGSMFLTVYSAVRPLDGLSHVYCRFRPLGQPNLRT